MVTNGTSHQANDSQYASNTLNVPVGRGNYSINPESIVKPDLFTLYFGFFGKWNWQRNFMLSLAGRIESARALLQRPPTQEEIDAFVVHSSRSVYQARIGAPLAGLAGAARLYTQARKSEKFAAYVPRGAPGGMSTPQQLFEGMRNFAIAEHGNFRQVAFRSLFKMIFWTMSGSLLSTVYAVYNDTKDTMKDPRLSDFISQMRHTDRDEIRRRKREAINERHQGIHQQPQVQSPELGAFAESHETHDQDQYTAFQSQDPKQAETQRNISYSQPTEPQGQSSYFFDDDASPTAPEYRQERNNDYTGSAWERIRLQNMQSQSQAPGRQHHYPAPHDQQIYAPSSPEQDRQREREQARADFEKILDAERNMSDPSGTGDQNKGWGSWK